MFSTYQSSEVVRDACAEASIAFDLMVLDEAHRSTGRMGSPFALPLDDLQLPAERRLFMTATPRTYTSRVKKRADEVELVVASMDDAESYGEELHHLSFAEAIERDLLSDYRVVVIGVEEAEARRFLDENPLVRTTPGETYSVRSAVAYIALAKAMRRFGERSILSFHSRVAAAEDFAKNLPAFLAWAPEDHRPAGTIEAYSVHGKMPMLQRARVLRRLAEADADRAVVVANARCLSEGVDVPTLDGLVFVDPRKSKIDIVQAVGRAIRKSVKGDGVSTIILPLMIGAHDDPEEIATSEGFGVVLDVLMALKSHDSLLAEEIDLLQRSRGRTGTVGRVSGERLYIELPVELPREAFDWLTIRVLDRVSGTIERVFGALERFVEREGHARVAFDHVEDGKNLGFWVANRRGEYRRGKLEPQYIARLAALPGWSWDPLADQFEEFFEVLQRFVEREGDARVGQSHVEDGVKLGTWVDGRRSDYRKGKLESEYIARLEKLPGWSWDPLADQFEEFFEVLERFVERERHARVPRSHVEGVVKLGNWVTHQRAKYRKGKLEPEYIARLAALPGWSWDPFADRFEENVRVLMRFVEREGHARVPAGHAEDGVRLGSWVGTRRSDYRKGKLEPEYIARLAALPGWSWDPFANRFEENVRVLMRFVEREGHARVPAEHAEDGVNLGGWVSKRRGQYREGKLEPEYIARLEKLPGWSWDRIADQFEEALGVLERFVEREGHARVPRSHVEEGLKLGNWVTDRRSEYRQSKLEPGHIAQLAALPGWVWDPHADRFEEAFGVLLRRVEREGHARVPRSHVEDGIRLGTWVDGRRSDYRKGKLDPERITRLESLPGWSWDPLADQF